jgi:hypothetical protein
MDVTEMSDKDLMDMLAYHKREFMASDDHRAWTVWRRIIPLVDERERRVLLRESLRSSA